MTDFSAYLADLVNDWMSQGEAMPTPPDPVYVVLFDDVGSELTTSLQNGRVGVTAGTGWTKNGTDFENAAEIDFGENTSGGQITIQDVALYDSDTGGSDNELARYQIETSGGSPTTVNVSDGTRVFFAAGELDFDVVDRTE